MATPASGLSAQIGYKLETVVNTPVTVTDFVPLISENIVRTVDKIESKAIIAGRRVMTTEQHAAGNESILGPVAHELNNKGSEVPLSLMFGAPTKTTAGQTTRVYDARDLFGLSATVQGARPDVTGVVQPFTWSGVKAQGFNIGLKINEFALLGLDLVAMNEILVRTVADGATTNASPTVTSATAAFTSDDVGKPISGTGIPPATYVGIVNSATSVGLSSTQASNTPVNATATGATVTFTVGVALAAASYLAATRAFTFLQGTVSAGGVVPSAVKSCLIKATMPQDITRRGIGSGRILQPIENNQRSFKVDIEAEFDGLTHYRRYLADSEHAFSLALAAGADTITITGNGYYELPPQPNVTGAGIVTQKIAMEMTASSTDASAFQLTLVNGVA